MSGVFVDSEHLPCSICKEYSYFCTVYRDPRNQICYKCNKYLEKLTKKSKKLSQ
jgi:hypothetical protein